MPADDVRETAARAVLTALGWDMTGREGPVVTEHSVSWLIRDAGDGRPSTRWATIGEVLDALHAAGYTIAPPGSVVVQLPEGVVADPDCPYIVTFDGRVDLQCDPADDAGDVIVDGAGETWTPEAAERHALALLAAARYGEAIPATGGAA